MSLPLQNGPRMRKFSLSFVLTVALATGCSAIGPTGSNASKTVYKTVDENGFVVLSVPKPADATKAVFVLRNPGDAEFADLEDSSPDGANEGEPCDGVEGFCVSFKPDKLPANVYLMDVFIDDEEQAKAAATIPFVVGGEAATDEEATPAEDGAATDAAATDAAATGG